MANPYDQFDNPYDQFEATPSPLPSPTVITGSEGKGFVTGLGEAAVETAKSLIPESVAQAPLKVAELATPVVPAIEHIIDEPKKLARLYEGLQEGKSFEQAGREAYGLGKTYPEFNAEDWGKFVGRIGIQAASALPVLGATRGFGLQFRTEVPTIPVDVPEPVIPPSEILPSVKLEPAFRMQDGTVIAGGKHHGETAERFGGDIPQSAEEGFVDSNTGTFLNRQEAADALSLRGVLHASDINDPNSVGRRLGFLLQETAPIGANVKGFEQTYGPGEIPAGETIHPEDAWAAAAARAETGVAQPYGFVERAKTGSITPQELADLIYEHQQLVNRAGAAEGTPAYSELYQRAQTFAKDVLKPAETAWHKSGMVMQIAVQPDYTSVTGLRNAATRMGQELADSELARAKELARENKRATANAEGNGERLLQAMDKEYRRGGGLLRRVKTAEELRNELMGVDPCVLG